MPCHAAIRADVPMCGFADVRKRSERGTDAVHRGIRQGSHAFVREAISTLAEPAPD